MRSIIRFLNSLFGSPFELKDWDDIRLATRRANEARDREVAEAVGEAAEAARVDIVDALNFALKEARMSQTAVWTVEELAGLLKLRRDVANAKATDLESQALALMAQAHDHREVGRETDAMFRAIVGEVFDEYVND